MTAEELIARLAHCLEALERPDASTAYPAASVRMAFAEHRLRDLLRDLTEAAGEEDRDAAAAFTAWLASRPAAAA